MDADTYQETVHDQIVRWMGSRRHSSCLSCELGESGWDLAALVCAAEFHPDASGSEMTPTKMRFLYDMCTVRALDTDRAAGADANDYAASGVSGVTAVMATVVAIACTVSIRVLEHFGVPLDLLNIANASSAVSEARTRVYTIERDDTVPAAGATLDWIVWCGRGRGYGFYAGPSSDQEALRLARILAALELGELDPEIALAFCLDCRPRRDGIDEVALSVADAITKAIDVAGARRGIARLQLPPVIV